MQASKTEENWCRLALKVMAIGVMITLSACQKPDNVVSSDDEVIVLGWDVAADGNPRIRSLNNRQVTTKIEVNRAHFFDGTFSSNGMGIGTAVVGNGGASSIGVSVGGNTYSFVRQSPTEFRYAPNVAGTGSIPLSEGKVVATVSGLSLSENQFEIPGTVSVSFPTSRDTVSRAGFTVNWQARDAGKYMVVLLRSLTNPSAGLVIKTMPNTSQTLIRFSADDLRGFPVNSAMHVMVSTMNLKRNGDAVLVGQTSGAQTFFMP
jgi:hypothetical protein